MPRRKNRKNKFNFVYPVYIALFIVFLFALYFLVRDGRAIFSRLGDKFPKQSVAEKNLNDSALNTEERVSVSSGPVFSSFFDSFASGHLIDITATNLFRDDYATAMMFPPDYKWQEAAPEVIEENKNNFTPIYLNDFSKLRDMSDRRCIGSSCLEQKGVKLFFQGRSISLPKGVKESDVQALSIGKLDKRWLVGITLKDGVNFEGRVYYFNGKSYSQLNFSEQTKNVRSPYLGVFGFGGQDSDFMVVYGAYRGSAFRFQDKKITDISKYFDFRVMAKGFKPEIIRAESDKVINWYVFSSSQNQPQLIKLWQNKDGNISGEVVFKDIFPSSVSSASFRLLDSGVNEFRLLARVEDEEKTTWHIFSDYGFINNIAGELIFNPVAVENEITIKKISNSKLGSPDTPCLEGKFSFSADNSNWRELPCGENLNQDFLFAIKNNYFLRVDFPAQADKFYSPFLTEVLFDFYYQK